MRRADLHVIDDAVAVETAGKGWIGEHHVVAVERQAPFRLHLSVEAGGQHVALEDAHVGQPAQRQVHRGEADHLGVDIVAVKGRGLQLAPLAPG